jgi:hypothetical protein
MPFIITDPETKTVAQRYLIDDVVQEVSAVRTIDHVNIEHVVISTPLNNPTGVTLSVKWSLGYLDGTVFFPTQRGTAELAGEALFTRMMEGVSVGASHYSDFKNALYILLASLGHIPAGVVV